MRIAHDQASRMIAWALYKAALNRLSRRFKTSKNYGPFNQTQEMARRRRQIAAGILRPGHNFIPAGG